MKTYRNFEELLTDLKPLQMGEVIPAVEITSALAEEILKGNIRNRNRREVRGNIEKIARALRTGNWNPSPIGTICFYERDLALADGQCRLSAVQATDVPIIVHIEKVKTVLGMDEGRQRSLAQHLFIEGVASPAEVAAVTKELFTISDSQIGRASAPEWLAFYKEHHVFIMDCVVKATGWLYPVMKRNWLFGIGKLAVLRALAIRQEPQWEADQVDIFLEDVVTGSGVIELATTLSEELGETKVQQRKERDMVMAALDAHMKGKTPKNLTKLKNPKIPPKRPGR